MPTLTRKRDPNRDDSWLVHYGDVHVGTIARRAGSAAELAGRLLSLSRSSARRTTATFEQARAAWRDQQAWTAEKYRRFDRGERMPPDWRPPHG